MSEYAAVRDGGAGLIDLSARGRILVSGSEVVMFLNGLITNDMKTLAPNSWMPAAFANVQGRLLAAARVIHREDGFLVDTEAATREVVLKMLERFTLAGDFRVADLTDEIASFSVQGKKAAELVRASLSDEAARVDREQVLTDQFQNYGAITLLRATHTAEDGFDLLIDKDKADQLREGLINAGARKVSREVVETLRIEAGIPRYAIDMDETNVVTETNLDEAISFTKGCYIGQEIIIRIKHRGHVAKKLTGIILEGQTTVESGAKILAKDDKEIGRVTSSAFSPRLARTVALGYVKYDYLEPSTPVKVVAAGKEHPAKVAALPLVRGSWYSD